MHPINCHWMFKILGIMSINGFVASISWQRPNNGTISSDSTGHCELCTRGYTLPFYFIPFHPQDQIIDRMRFCWIAIYINKIPGDGIPSWLPCLHTQELMASCTVTGYPWRVNQCYMLCSWRSQWHFCQWLEVAICKWIGSCGDNWCCKGMTSFPQGGFYIFVVATCHGERFLTFWWCCCGSVWGQSKKSSFLIGTVFELCWKILSRQELWYTRILQTI